MSWECPSCATVWTERPDPQSAGVVGCPACGRVLASELLGGPDCPDCDKPGMWCDEHQQWECADGNCDRVGPVA